MSAFIKLISNVVNIVKNELNSTTLCIYCNMPYLSLAIQLHQEICEQNTNNFDEINYGSLKNNCGSDEINCGSNKNNYGSDEINCGSNKNNYGLKHGSPVSDGSPKQDIASNGKITIYVLLLEDNRYYIGKSAVIDLRLEQHFNDCGSSWTKKYKPIKVIEVVPNSDTFDEDKYTLKYMSKYGVDMVRGGSFCQIKLNDERIQIIEHMLNSTSDKCYNCEEIGHYSKECPNKIQPTTKVIECTRCGHNGHIINNCYAKKHVNGMILYTVKSGSKDPKFALGQVDDVKASQTCHTKNLEKNQVTSSKSSCRYCQKQFTTTKGTIYHENMHCNKNPKRY